MFASIKARAASTYQSVKASPHTETARIALSIVVALMTFLSAPLFFIEVLAVVVFGFVISSLAILYRELHTVEA